MAALLTSFNQNVSPVSVGREVWVVNMNGGTTATITPAKVKAIDAATIIPDNAAAEGTGYLTSFTPGSPTVTITGAATGLYIIIVEGTVA